MLKLTSPVFADGGSLPVRCTCEGEDVPPELHIDNSLAGARSLVLIVDDPDAPDPANPRRTWVHYVAYNIAPTTSVLFPRGTRALPVGGLEGKNDWNKPGWRGPCPPVGRHRYFFKLYALDDVLPDLGTPTKAQLVQAMREHILADVALVGTYEKQEEDQPNA